MVNLTPDCMEMIFAERKLALGIDSPGRRSARTVTDRPLAALGRHRLHVPLLINRKIRGLSILMLLASSASAITAEPVDYVKQIKPIFKALGAINCYHSYSLA